MKELLQELAEIDGEQKIKVGAKTSFFFCGTVNQLLDNMNQYSDSMKLMAFKIARSAEMSHKKLVNNPPSLTIYAMGECNRATPRMTMEGWNNEVKRWFENVLRSEMHLRDVKNYSTEFVWLGKRKVKEIRDADEVIDPATKIIVIDGNERGRFWTFEEVKGSNFGLQNEEEDDDAV